VLERISKRSRESNPGVERAERVFDCHLSSQEKGLARRPYDDLKVMRSSLVKMQQQKQRGTREGCSLGWVWVSFAPQKGRRHGFSVTVAKLRLIPARKPRPFQRLADSTPHSRLQITDPQTRGLPASF
jgi:hypothetical protein